MIDLPDPDATATLGARIGAVLARSEGGMAIALSGELGAGKTALARAVLRALGHTGAVASPSYTLVEPYAVAGRMFHHLDLYRLGDPEELEFLGIREIDPARDWLCVEWADRGAGFLPSMDATIELQYHEPGRRARVSAHSAAGERLLAALENAT
ncbi:tRNA (adenosine(37)-N6)-threonylcarbamoyltransferase complex ATPase subunit type 1 TsaE [Salinisphaera orenii]|uniref:tRNA (adenosine(37)-N6)-threonylcarbamoyltransferase complex ATPase subunit type 1 TsaE n=1 Tax=Salinisphaera orenii TaxID=856731 RepID=UPI000F47FB34|nr:MULTISPECIES: tRNA (adenosine(37)-N6)-threonylcarbamoyltransferase complex ATPase subunit type 1 TsaE [Salinisphaera]